MTANESNHHHPSSSTDLVQTDLTWKKLQSWSGSCYNHFRDSSASHRTANHDHASSTVQASGSKIPSYDSICFDDLSSEKDSVRPTRVPASVMCLIMFNISDARKEQPHDRRFMSVDPLRLSWLNDVAYSKFYSNMVNFVKDQEPTAERSWLKIAHVGLCEWTGAKFQLVKSCVIEYQEDWFRHVPGLIANYCGQDTSCQPPFYLEVHCEFEYFTLESYGVDELYQVLEDTQLKNFRNKTFWSKKLLKELFNENVVTGMVQSYITTTSQYSRTTRSQQSHHLLTQQNGQGFVEWILQDRIRLLAIVIRARIDIARLYVLASQGRDAVKDHQIPLADKHLGFLRRGDVDAFKSAQRGFRPYSFPDPRPQPGDESKEDYAVDVDQLVPINHDVDNRIGRGGFGEVWKITIHPDFHAFSPNRLEEYALKIINNSNDYPAVEEVKAWQLVARIPHKHITPLYASWLQNKECFMLSPLADRSLKDLINSGEVFDVGQQTEWLLKQIEGLAAGIYHIHHIGRISLDQPGGLPRLDFDCGYHHDLKPANILIFERLIWKIGDFGTAKIRKLISGKEPWHPYTDGYPGGDREYGGPDRYIHPNLVGRRYDIWSFGCILLEVLLWAFGRGGKYLGSFHQARCDDPCDDCSCIEPDRKGQTPIPTVNLESHSGSSNGRGGPQFWYRCRKRRDEFHLKRCVMEQLDWIKQEAQKFDDYECLLRLTNCVADMLNVEPNKRPVASDIKDRVGELRFRANFHFSNNSSILNPRLETQPDTFIKPVATGDVLTQSEAQSQTGGDIYPASESYLSKRKADEFDKFENGSLQIGNQFLTSQRPSGTRPTKIPRLRVDSTDTSANQLLAEPRSVQDLVTPPASVWTDESPNSSQMRTSDHYIKESNDPSVIDKMASDASSKPRQTR